LLDGIPSCIAWGLRHITSGQDKTQDLQDKRLCNTVVTGTFYEPKSPKNFSGTKLIRGGGVMKTEPEVVFWRNAPCALLESQHVLLGGFATSPADKIKLKIYKISVYVKQLLPEPSLNPNHPRTFRAKN
jgi:hypothetical protein